VKAPKVLEHIKPAHIACTKEDIAPIVVMPGDPLRAKYIAEKYLSEAKLVSDTRNMFIYTGFYKGKRITVMGSGMGMPSMSIYAFELFYFFGVEKIIRVGTCGGLTPDLDIPDIIIADSSYNEGNFAYSYNGDTTHLVYPDKELNNTIIKTANELNLHTTLGTVMSTEQFGFYSDNEHVLSRIPKNIHVIGEEMESFALFHIANSFDKKASCILTVVDSKFSEKFMSQEDREKSLDESITLALESIIK
jgi:purine-nucleoside phosphorylase